ncbi:MAG: Na+/H+ antiporter NhaC family protein, partial [Flavobacteriaceae bacterium]|nr:Na+/H+ antiporter NhaC family protein [Flavobacteriaceae bacterium]
MGNSKEISLNTSIFPIILLVSMLVYNIFNNEWLGTYTFHLTLLITALSVSIIGLINNIKISEILIKIYKSVKSIKTPIIILLLVGALAGTWKVSGVIPAMVYYGINFINPSIFLPLTLIITAIVSLTAGSSYITSATIGVALVSVGNAFGISPSMTAGAVISGAYFGDKMSPLSDTTNLASAISGTDLYTHIKYMMYTTFPTFIITFIVFCIITLNLNSSSSNDAIEIGVISEILKKDFYISPLLFVIPASVLVLAYFKVKPLIALSFGVLFAVIFSIIFQSNILEQIDMSTSKAIFNSVFTFTEIPLEVIDNTKNTRLLEGINDLYTRGGMESMLWVILLTICAMVFGGAMEAIGALNKITKELLKLADSAFGLVTSTVASCLGVNLFASDQYLAIIIPGKMFKKAYKENDLAPENLSRTLEDSGTVTSALIPWNTCGAYHYGVLGVTVIDYFVYAIFNWLSP